MTYILYNPLANGGHGEEGLGAVQAALADKAPRTLDIMTVDVKDFLTTLPAEDEVILCGGDGTINHLMNDLGGAAPTAPVRVWRFGTGNDFVRDVTNGEPAQTVLLNPYLETAPTAVMSDGRLRRFLNGCSCGVDALVCDMLEQARRARSQANYVLLAVKALLRKYRTVAGRVTVDGVTREYKKIWMAVAMNGRFQGGGMRFAPDQDRGGGTLCCMVWHDSTPLGTLLRFPSVIRGTHTKYRSVCDMLSGREITVELDEPTTAQLDGEVLRGMTGFTARK